MSRPGPAARDKRTPQLANLAAAREPQAAGSKRRIWLLAAAIVAAGTIAWLLTLRRYPNFLADDTFISLRYVDRLLEGRGLTWDDAERVEGYSNLLWMLFAAGLGSVGIDLLTSVQALGVLTTIGVLGALCFAFLEPTLRSAAVVAIAAAIWAFAVPVAVWSLAGLEQPLVACLLAWALAVLIRWLRNGWPEPRRFLIPGLLLGGSSLTRPDGALFTTAIAAALYWEGKRSASVWRRIGWLVLPSIVLLAGQETFRVLYYGEWLPNVYYVKVSPSVKHVLDGLRYVWRGLWALSPMSELAILGLAAAIARPAMRQAALFVAVPLVAWLGYLAWIGGDIFPAWRHMLPAITLLCFAMGLGLASWTATERRSPRALVAIAVPLFVWYGIGQAMDAQNRRAQKEFGEGNGRLIGTVLRRGFAATQPLLAVTNAGVVPYWSKLPCIDMLGLCDRHIARTHPANFGSGLPGHELGDSRYLLDRNPDLILFGSPGGHEPNWTYRDIDQLPEFTLKYTPCNIDGGNNEFRSRIFVNRASDKIGIERRDGEIFVPPYFFNATGGGYTTWLDADNRFYVYVTPELPVGITELELEQGTWRVVEPTEPIRIAYRDESKPDALESQMIAGQRSLVVPATGRYTLVFLGTTPGETWIYGLRLQRVGS